MPVKYFIDRVYPRGLMQWDGTNFEEVRGFVYYEISITEENGVLTLRRGMQMPVTCMTGSWVDSGGTVVSGVTDKQEVPSAAINLLTEPITVM